MDDRNESIEGPTESRRRRAGSAVTAAIVMIVLLGCAALGVWIHEPDRPRPKADQSKEVEQMIAAQLGDSFGGASISLVPYESGTDFPFSQSWREWAYVGSYTLGGSSAGLAFFADATPYSLQGTARQDIKADIDAAGGLPRLAALSSAVASEFPHVPVYSIVPYAYNFSGDNCSDPRHAQVPKLVRNRLGAFDPLDVVRVEAGDWVMSSSVDPDSLDELGLLAWFAYDTTNRDWRRLPDEADEVFFNTVIHVGCDLEGDWLASPPSEEPTANLTTVVSY